MNILNITNINCNHSPNISINTGSGVRILVYRQVVHVILFRPRQAQSLSISGQEFGARCISVYKPADTKRNWIQLTRVCSNYQLDVT